MFDVKAALNEIKEIAEKNDLMDWKLDAMYGSRYADTVSEKLNCHAWMHYSEYSSSSKNIIKAEIIGTIKHLKGVAEAKAKLANSPKVKIRILEGQNKGKVKEVADYIAKDFIAIGFAELA